MRLFAGTQWDRPPTCERCSQPEESCQCPPLPPPEKPIRVTTPVEVKISLQRRKNGKQVTVVAGLSAEQIDLAGLLTELKNGCGAGGTIKDDCLEIQGTQQERVAALLKEFGYKVKR